MEFAVKVDDWEQASWVIAVDPQGERFLMATPEGVFEWVAITRCRFVKGATPDNPRLVMAVQPQAQIAVPNAALFPNGGRG